MLRAHCGLFFFFSQADSNVLWWDYGGLVCSHFTVISVVTTVIQFPYFVNSSIFTVTFAGKVTGGCFHCLSFVSLFPFKQHTRPKSLKFDLSEVITGLLRNTIQSFQNTIYPFFFFLSAVKFLKDKPKLLCSNYYFNSLIFYIFFSC